MTVDAVLHQARPPHEIIVVDDGSDDNTAEMLSATYDKAVRYIRIENSGDLVARNVGTRAARGDVVAYCDSDDVWREDFLAKVEALWQIAPEIRSVYSNFVLIE